MSSSETPQPAGESETDRTVEMSGVTDASLPSDARPTETAHGTEPRGDGTIPKRIGHYVIKRAIGSGGIGTVYEATQERSRRTVAVKVMRHGVTSRSARRRFEQEPQLLPRLHDPGIAQVFEAGAHESPDGLVPFFAMEFISGTETLTAYAQKSEIGVRQRIELFGQVCDAVEHGHQCGIIHRGLKPSNILVGATGRVKIIDVGIARATDSDIAVTTMRTDVGELIGTLQNMSPEQREADPSKIDPRSDVYALGVTLFELLCGRLPYNIRNVPVYEAARTHNQSGVLRLCRRVMAIDDPPYFDSSCGRPARGQSSQIARVRQWRFPSATSRAWYSL